MAKLAMNKSSLKKQRDQLKLFQKFLPALDLKKQQLLIEQKKAQQEYLAVKEELDQLTGSISGLMEPLGASNMDLSSLVKIDSVVIEEENFVGAKLPIAREVKFGISDYSTFAKPFWVDFLVEYLQEMATLRIHEQVKKERWERLKIQVRRITQRVNLFEKVLIPNAKQNIKDIQLGLAEEERSAVVRSKIAKSKNKTKAGA